jgi:hypothetical protein
MNRLLRVGFGMIGLFVLGFGTLFAADAPAAANGVKMDTTSSTYVLFLDMQEVESMKNVEMVVNQAEKFPGNPVLPTGDMNAWDFNQAATWGGSVIYDEDEKIFKLWYAGARGGLDGFLAEGYAWSEDGIYWHKPNLGLYEYNGSKENNIIWRSPTGGDVFGVVRPNWTDHMAVMKDIKEPDPQKRYKGWNIIYSPTAKKNLHYPLYSPDGLHWKLGANPVPHYPVSDIGNAIIDDADPDPNRRIKIYGHQDSGYGPDIEHCIPNPNGPLLPKSNPPDPEKDGLEDLLHLSSVIHYKSYYVMVYNANFWMEYYGMKGKESIRHRDGRVPEPKTGIFTGDSRLAVSRDGVSNFQRVHPYQAVIARGNRGEWDGGFIVATPGAVVHDDKIYFFYTGVDEISGIVLPQWEEPDDPFATRSGLATLRLDGFTNLQTRDGLSRGIVTTKPIEVKMADKARLVVNASQLIPYRDWVEVEVLDAKTDLPIEGYAQKDGTPLFHEGVRLPVEWGKHKTLDGVKAGAIKLRFHLYGKAKLYSFHFD